MVVGLSTHGDDRRGVGSRRRPVQARALETREQIVEATAQVLAREGYDGLTTNAVAARAGVGVGTLYRYFVDKDDLFSAVLSRTGAHIQNRFDTIFTVRSADSEGREIRHAINAIGLAVLDAVSEHRDVVQILTQQVSASSNLLLGPVEDATARITRGLYFSHHRPGTDYDRGVVDLVIDTVSGLLASTCFKLAATDHTTDTAQKTVHILTNSLNHVLTHAIHQVSHHPATE
ncbi:TetR/AcrR family transcriptional regulator [Nocardia terpenica]|uniref:TetR/AcrR family transcriptional regulator n=1 Tax=Nocardia terpenica TaxID=455432 RepID=UPI0009EF30EE|nr:TetR/AcrR family transcriptional regulator [Nocardia terpenica]NQE92403.1 TetR/AcrR family transcriptional regulator [Nocardia terpenica]